jgi:hypothetical protein
MLIALSWLVSLAGFVGLRANATKARLERGDGLLMSAHGITARWAYRRDAAPNR